MKFSESQRENTNKHTTDRDDAKQSVITTDTCPATPERIRSYYEVKASKENPNINVPSCVSTTRVQSTRYQITPFNRPKQLSFDDDHRLLM